MKGRDWEGSSQGSHMARQSRNGRGTGAAPNQNDGFRLHERRQLERHHAPEGRSPKVKAVDLRNRVNESSREGGEGIIRRRCGPRGNDEIRQDRVLESEKPMISTKSREQYDRRVHFPVVTSPLRRDRTSVQRIVVQRRANFAVNCASIDCPPLAASAYTGAHKAPRRRSPALAAIARLRSHRGRPPARDQAARLLRCRFSDAGVSWPGELSGRVYRQVCRR